MTINEHSRTVQLREGEVCIVMSKEMRVALKKFIGKSSRRDRIMKGLTKSEAQILEHLHGLVD